MDSSRRQIATALRRVSCAVALSIVALVAWPSVSAGAIAYVNSASTALSSSGTTCAMTLGAVTAGNTNVVIVSIPTSSSVSSISDGASTYASRVTINNTNSNTARIEVWSATIAPGAGTTVTVTLAASNTRRVCAVSQYSGVVALGTTATNTNTTANPTISLTTQDSNNWVVAGFAALGATVPTARTGNLRQAKATSSGTTESGALNDNTVGAPGSVTNAITLGATTWAAAALELRTCGVISDPTYVTANGQNTQATIYWSSANPVIILRKTSAFVASDDPVNGVTYAQGNTVGSATVQYVGSGSSFNQTSLTATTTYYYKLFANSSACYSNGVEFNVKPAASAPDWTYVTNAPSLAPPGINPNNVVVAGANDSNVHTITASDGSMVATPYATLGAIQARPPIIPAEYSVTGADVAYITSQAGYIYAIDTNTGALLWQSPSLAAANMLQGGASVWLQGVEALTICGTTTDVVIVGTRNTATTSGNKIYALNGGTTSVTTTGGGNCTSASVAPGGIIWTYTGGSPNPNLDIISSTPFIDYTNNAIWVTSRANAGTTQPSVWKLNAANGTLASGTATWNFNDIDASPTPSTDGTFMYVGTVAGTLRAIRISNGTSVTHTPASGSGAVKGMPWPLSFNAIGAGIALVNSASAAVNSSTCSAALGSVTVGNTNVVVVATGSSSATVSSISDGASTYTSRVTMNGGTTSRVEIWTATIAPGASSTVTVTLGSSVRQVCAAAQYSGVVALGTTSTASNTTANPTISRATQDPYNWVVAGFAGANTSVPTAGTGNLRQARATTFGTGNVTGALNDNYSAGTATVVNTVTDGAVQWAAAALELRGSTPGLPTPDNIIFTRNTTIHSVSFNGTTFGANWTKTLTGTPTVSAPVDDGAGNVYIGASDGKVHQLDASDGTDVKQVTLPGPTATAGDPAFDSVLNRIYVGSSDGHVYAFSTPF